MKFLIENVSFQRLQSHRGLTHKNFLLKMLLQDVMKINFVTLRCVRFATSMVHLMNIPIWCTACRFLATSTMVKLPQKVTSLQQNDCNVDMRSFREGQTHVWSCGQYAAKKEALTSCASPGCLLLHRQPARELAMGARA